MESSLLEDKVTRDKFNGEHHIHPEKKKVKIKRRVSSSDIITNMFPGNETKKNEHPLLPVCFPFMHIILICSKIPTLLHFFFVCCKCFDWDLSASVSK